MMGRLETTFATLKRQGKTALIPFVTAGRPGLQSTSEIMLTLAEAGADIVELGIPFSDPMADGPSIQHASEKALAAGTTLRGVIDCVASFRRKNTLTPVVLMGYTNSLEAMGYERFAVSAAAAGVDAVLLVDLPPDEGARTAELLREHGLATIYLIAPTTKPERRRLICGSATGFVYYVSVKGTTGGASASVADVERDVRELRGLTQLPIGIGFGIRTPAQAAGMAAIGDAVIVGSVLVDLIERHEGGEPSLLARIHDFLAEFRFAMDSITGKQA